MTIKEQIEVMQHFAGGGEIEGTYINDNNWEAASGPCWNFAEFKYRIKPEPQKIPLDASDITPITWIRKKDFRYSISAFNNLNVFFINNGIPMHSSYKNLMDNGWKISTNPNKFDWRKCEKEG